ncbi:lytic murein transglycosylase [Desulfurivibrio dismutans]|uniref:lytic murein transglycosylase n=1 Tax=Desulfurivibrio dismutans TaxID=1398908 RepID=UPI0023DBC385|nr:lytic murein transglycosylase [Desulfurivibrio alkaliphilus]MDF1613756.1 lytic murein transglycosylase [Desulfurivibrio alkaliphilus]
MLLWSGVSPAAAGELPAEVAAPAADGRPLELDSAAYRELLRELVDEHGFRQAQLEQWFGGVTIQGRVLELMDAQWEARPYHRYAAPLHAWWNVGNGRVLLKRHAGLLDRIEEEFGVEREIVVAIWGLESNYGGQSGSFRIFRTMNTIFAAYPRRSEFYRRQLIDFLLICRELELDPRTVRGSYGGAFGQAQFIPSSYRAYAVDFDGSGRRDIINSVPDVLASIANYLRHFGWRYGEPWYAELGPQLHDPRLTEAAGAGRRGVLPRPVIEQAQGVELPPSHDNRPLRIVALEQAGGGHRYLAAYPNFQAITHWNNSFRYAMAVIELAEKLGAE